jgi:hypothetical protein
MKQKLEEVISVAERFPESVRELVYQSLVEALLQEGNPGLTALADKQGTRYAAHPSVARESRVIDHESASAFSRYFEQYEGVKLNDMEFCAVVARFFTREISKELRVDSIGPDLLSEAVQIAKRPKRPKNPATTLNNAKNVGKFLESRGKGVYGISENGIRELDRKLKVSARWTP